MNLLTQPLERPPSGNCPEDVMPAGEQVERALKASRGLTRGPQARLTCLEASARCGQHCPRDKAPATLCAGGGTPPLEEAQWAGRS